MIFGYLFIDIKKLDDIEEDFPNIINNNEPTPIQKVFEPEILNKNDLDLLLKQITHFSKQIDPKCTVFTEIEPAQGNAQGHSYFFLIFCN